MAKTATPALPQTAVIGRANLTSPTALTTRTSITGTTGLTQLTATTSEGLRVDQIRAVAKGTTSAGLLSVWIYDGTTSTLWDEITVSAVTPSTTVAAHKSDTYYSINPLVLPATYQLYVSVTVANDLAVTAHGASY